ncbi:MAG: PepSY domain-containing protein [Colwelliaceae bacterium]|nr:PepSY domain-containing protein [Colwelliaceae bacterium]
MNTRKVLFWTHLLLGCSAAIFIFLMSITGVALTYERQMIKTAEQADYPAAPASHSQTLPMTDFVNIAKQYKTKRNTEVVLINEQGAPVLIKDGRKTIAYLNPFTAQEMERPGEATVIFLGKLRAFHRWLTLDGKFSETGRWVNGIANIIFIVLALTGLYLWLPKRFNKRAVKQKLVLTGNYQTKTVRNYQWHNVFGFYALPVLLVVTVTAVFFSFKWPGQTLKQYVSSEATSLPKPTRLPVDNIKQTLSINQQINIVKEHEPQWQTIRFALSEHPTDLQLFSIDTGNGGEPQKRMSLALDTINGTIIQEQRFEQLSNYQKVRSYIRFLHTGEAFGLIGQTLAGLASLIACLLVYTGIMLSWRRWVNSRENNNSNMPLNANNAK